MSDSQPTVQFGKRFQLINFVLFSGLVLILGGGTLIVVDSYNWLNPESSNMASNIVTVQATAIPEQKQLLVDQQAPEVALQPDPNVKQVSENQEIEEGGDTPLQTPGQSPVQGGGEVAGVIDRACTPPAMECKEKYIQALEESKSKKVIIVDITNQRMKTMSNGNVIVDSLVTTGKDGFSTPIGTFQVKNKARNVILKANAALRARGQNYRVKSDMWLGLGGGYGIHDAYRWRRTYGNQDYHRKGSHGCVNTPLNAMKDVYNWAEVGTSVYIIN